MIEHIPDNEFVDVAVFTLPKSFSENGGGGCNTIGIGKTVAWVIQNVIHDETNRVIGRTDPVPKIILDDGGIIYGWDCWWVRL